MFLEAPVERHLAASGLVDAAADRMHYVLALSARARAKRLTDEISLLEGELVREESAKGAYDKWSLEERCLVLIRDDLVIRHKRMHALHAHISGKKKTKDNEATKGYLEHVYHDVILPRIAAGMNSFLERTAQFRVVSSPHGDMEVRFVDDGYTTQLNNLGGADRFLLELAGRCALRQVGTPGFNWPIAFIDEGFVAFDSSRRERIADALAALVSVGGFEKVVLTSHMESVKDVCMQTLTIQRTGNKSLLMCA